jgi:hypothetical protein
MKYNIVDQQLRVPRDDAYPTYFEKPTILEGGYYYTPSVTFYLYAILYLFLGIWIGWKSGGKPETYCYTLFELSAIDPNDRNMNARQDSISYDAAEFSYDGIWYVTMLMIKF